jgi:hypothetical protein
LPNPPPPHSRPPPAPRLGRRRAAAQEGGGDRHHDRPQGGVGNDLGERLAHDPDQLVAQILETAHPALEDPVEGIGAEIDDPVRNHLQAPLQVPRLLFGGLVGRLDRRALFDRDTHPLLVQIA